MVQAVDEIVARHPHDTVVIATHGGPIRAFFCHAIGATLGTFRKISLDNCGITTFSLDEYGGWFIEVMNDTYHMDEAWAKGCSHDETMAIDKAF